MDIIPEQIDEIIKAIYYVGTGVWLIALMITIKTVSGK